MARSPGYCSVCKRNIRGSSAAHQSTRTHKLAVLRLEKRRGSKVVGRVAATRRANAGQSRRTNVDNYLGSIAVRVTRHRRSKPNDGKARVVPVIRHYRMPPAVYSTIEKGLKGGGRPYRVLRSVATGDVLRVWYAGRGAK